MIKINIENNIELFQNYQNSLDFLNLINYDDYSYPEYVTNFHVYSEIKNEKELLCIESYLATQNLKKTKLILWSDYSIENNELIQPYKHLIDMRVYDVREESIGTVLENNKKWFSANDSKHYMKSGVLRFLVTHKYGGVWTDMDMVLLRDFKPILDQEWAYMWGSEMDFENFGPCAAMMNIHKQSEHSLLCMKEIVATKVAPNSTALDHVLLAKVYKKKKFTVFPSVFFNTEWQMNVEYENGLLKKYDPQGIGTKIESGWFKKNEYSNFLFEEAFSWHWHNSSHKNDFIELGSKFNLLMQKTKNMLREKGVL